MKNLSFIIFIGLLLSCSKTLEKDKETLEPPIDGAHVNPINGPCSNNAEELLRSNVGSEIYEQLDFEKAFKHSFTNDEDQSTLKNILQIPFKEKEYPSDFILLLSNEEGMYIEGTIVNISEESFPIQESFTGVIKYYDLDGTFKSEIIVEQGMKAAAHPCEECLPDVFVYTTYPPNNSGGGIIPTRWLNFVGAFTGLGGGENGGVFGNFGFGSNPFGAGSGGSTGEPQGGGETPSDPCGTPTTPVIIVEDDGGPRSGIIDLDDYFKCFDNISNNGASYNIKLYADIPVNNKPQFLTSGVTPGHAFITLTKANGIESVSQTFGFYPKSTWASVAFAPVESCIVDNGAFGKEHEFNASINMDISDANFESLLILAKSYANMDYDLNDYNCTDFALQCFNYSRPGNEIIIPDLILPNGSPIAPVPANYDFGQTPNVLYTTLKSMKESGHPEANNIEVGVKYSTRSKGVCN